MTRSHRTRLAGVMLTGLSAGLPFTLLQLMTSEPTREQAVGLGAQCLFLPSGMDRLKDCLTGWEELRVPAVEEQPLPLHGNRSATGAFVAEPKGEGDSFRVEVYGFVNEGSHRLYCFLDTVAMRWFRLPEGQVDEKAQVALLRGSDGLQPELVDLLTGNAYQIEPGLAHLKAVLPVSKEEDR